MSNEISDALKAQIFAQESDDPFLALITLTNVAFTARLVNNSTDIISRGFTYTAFPMNVRMPNDDGETSRDFEISFENVSRDLIENFRTVTGDIGCKVEMILASIPDVVQVSYEDMLIRSITYNATKISARVILDSFLAVEIPGERYTPALYPGMF